MKICDSWLQDWVVHGLGPEELASRLTMLGLEVESSVTLGPAIAGLVVGRVVGLRRHPNADKLSLCTVDVGAAEPLPIVCGAPNVREGALYATALEGARFPGGAVIRRTTIRGETSLGMLCSASELGLEGTDGLLELDADAVPGDDASRLLRLDDFVLDINVTPNRADCLSIRGIAREAAVASGQALQRSAQAPVSPLVPDQFPVVSADPADCPRFAGRVIRGIDPAARTPLWMQERLRRCGVRPIHPVVDVTNYVMLELGQPMHAYDLASLRERIIVRRALAGERLVLLDGQQAVLDPDVLVIAHRDGPVGIAGIMGGSATAVNAATRDILLESAFFSPAAIAGRARRYGLHTEASLRFERGVDPALQVEAIESATRHIVAIAGGSPGPVADVASEEHLPRRHPVRLRRARLRRVLGAAVPDAEVAGVLGRIGSDSHADAGGWTVTPPSARFDLGREEDLIEEVARVYGYDRIEPAAGRAVARPAPVGESPDPAAVVSATLVARGYYEAITYSFVDPGLEQRMGFAPARQLELANPISAELAVMRQSLWPGLVKAARDNLHRQQDRVRLYEFGVRFLAAGPDEHREQLSIAGVVVGARLPEQWGAPAEPADFHDVKADVEALFAVAGRGRALTFVADRHAALHPGRSARICLEGSDVGWLGELHPSLCREFEMPAAILFEIAAQVLIDRPIPSYTAISRFPSIRRDIAVVVPASVPASELLATVTRAAPSWLRDVFVFDIYTGPQVGAAEKSVAMGLIFQETSRTLTDQDADGVIQAVRLALTREWGAKIRE